MAMFLIMKEPYSKNKQLYHVAQKIRIASKRSFWAVNGMNAEKI